MSYSKLDLDLDSKECVNCKQKKVVPLYEGFSASYCPSTCEKCQNAIKKAVALVNSTVNKGKTKGNTKDNAVKMTVLDNPTKMLDSFAK